MSEFHFSVVGPIRDSHFGELGSVLIHTKDYPAGVHLATVAWPIAQYIAAAEKDLTVANARVDELEWAAHATIEEARKKGHTLAILERVLRTEKEESVG